MKRILTGGDVTPEIIGVTIVDLVHPVDGSPTSDLLDFLEKGRKQIAACLEKRFELLAYGGGKDKAVITMNEETSTGLAMQSFYLFLGAEDTADEYLLPEEAKRPKFRVFHHDLLGSSPFGGVHIGYWTDPGQTETITHVHGTFLLDTPAKGEVNGPPSSIPMGLADSFTVDGNSERMARFFLAQKGLGVRKRQGLLNGITYHTYRKI